MLTAGSRAPDFTLSDQHGEELVLSELLADGPVALVFFPLAFSSVCTGELELLNERRAEFEKRGVRLLAISVDSVHASRAWADQEGYDFSLLSDFWPHGGVAEAYDAFDAESGRAKRVTVFVTPDRRVSASFETAAGVPRDFEDYASALALVDSRRGR